MSVGGMDCRSHLNIAIVTVILADVGLSIIFGPSHSLGDGEALVSGPASDAIGLGNA